MKESALPTFPQTTMCQQVI